MSGPSRRDVVMGGALLAGAGGALAMEPRDRLTLLRHGQTLENMVPKQLAEWHYVPTAGIVLPKTPGSLADKLYGEVLSRAYFSDTRPPVLLVIAYGPVQNDLLQLHRPEVCYSAVGFEISETQRISLDLVPGAVLPMRELVARNDSRVETIYYWTRIGDDLPASGTEQRLVKLGQQFDGYISDGVLVRMSCVVPPSPEVYRELGDFAKALAKGVPAADRPALVGRPLAAKLA